MEKGLHPSRCYRSLQVANSRLKKRLLLNSSCSEVALTKVMWCQQLMEFTGPSPVVLTSRTPLLSPIHRSSRTLIPCLKSTHPSGRMCQKSFMIAWAPSFRELTSIHAKQGSSKRTRWLRYDSWARRYLMPRGPFKISVTRSTNSWTKQRKIRRRWWIVKR